MIDCKTKTKTKIKEDEWARRVSYRSAEGSSLYTTKEGG